MAKTHPPYSREFRERAVDLLRNGGKTVEELAQDLGVSDQTLRNWRRQSDIDAGCGRPGDLSTADKTELRALQRENRVLREEREVLKKAVSFFAKEMSR